MAGCIRPLGDQLNVAPYCAADKRSSTLLIDTAVNRMKFIATENYNVFCTHLLVQRYTYQGSDRRQSGRSMLVAFLSTVPMISGVTRYFLCSCQ